jgi:hypothetical protein
LGLSAVRDDRPALCVGLAWPRGSGLDVQLIAGARLQVRGGTQTMAKKAAKGAKKKGGKKR